MKTKVQAPPESGDAERQKRLSEIEKGFSDLGSIEIKMETAIRASNGLLELVHAFIEVNRDNTQYADIVSGGILDIIFLQTKSINETFNDLRGAIGHVESLIKHANTTSL